MTIAAQAHDRHSELPHGPTRYTEVASLRRQCGGCGDSYEPTRTDSRYCSGACRQAAYRKRHTTPREPRRRRPIIDAWRDAAADLRRAADRLDRLMADDRFPASAERIVYLSAHDMARAAEVISLYIDASRKVIAPGGNGTRARQRAVTAAIFGDGSAEVAR